MKVSFELAQDASSPRPHRHRRRPVACQLGQCYAGKCAHLVLGLLILVSLLVGRSLVLVWDALLLVQGLPSVTKDLADLTCSRVSACVGVTMFRPAIPKLMPGFSSRTFSRCSLAKNM